MLTLYNRQHIAYNVGKSLYPSRQAFFDFMLTLYNRQLMAYNVWKSLYPSRQAFIDFMLIQ